MGNGNNEEPADTNVHNGTTGEVRLNQETRDLSK